MVEQTGYGYYFKEDTDVTVTAADDGPSSGLQTISFYTVDVEGGRTDYDPVPVSTEGTITFTVPANFKGQIYAKATDNVGNTPTEVALTGKAMSPPTV